MAGDAGLGMAAVQKISHGRPASEVIRETARVQIAISTIATLIVVPIAASQASVGLALALAAIPILTAIGTTYVLQSNLDARWIAISQILGNLTVCVVGISAAVAGLPVWAIALAYPAGLAVSTLVVDLRARARVRDLVGLLSVREIRSQARTYAALTAFTIVVHAYSACLLIISGIVDGGSHLTGIGLATRVLLLLVIPAQILGSMLLPRYWRQSPTRRHVLAWATVAFAVGIVASVASALMAPIYVPLMFGADAVPFVPLVQIIGLQVPLSLATTVLSAYYLSSARYVTLAVCYLLGLGVQIGCALAFAEASSEVFVTSILISELAFTVALIAALRGTAKGRAKTLSPT